MTDYEIASCILDVISCIIGIVGLLSLFLLFKQIKIVKQQNKEHYESLRRENTVKIITEWNNSLRKESRLAEKIVAKFDKEQCKALYNYNSLSVNKNSFNLICQLCSEKSDSCKKCQVDKKTKMYIIDNIPETELRGYVVSYLNNLEIVAIAWQQAIVDRKMLEQQFSFLYNASNDKSALETYREIAGNGHSYPVLKLFYEKIKMNASIDVDKKQVQ